MANPFDDLIPQQPAENAFADLVPQESSLMQDLASAARKLTPAGILSQPAERLTDARDVLAGVAKIGPTALKGVGDIAQMITGGKIGSGLSDSMKTGMESIDATAGSERLQQQKSAFGKIMADPNMGAADMIRGVIANPNATMDTGITTIGSMLLPAGAAKGAVMLGAGAKGATAATIGTGAAMNAADTYTSIDSPDQADKYKGAALSGAASLLLGKLTAGGAEGEIARRIAGAAVKNPTIAGAVQKIFGGAIKEGVQEAGEESGNYIGESIGNHADIDPNQLSKRATLGGALGAVMGGGVNLASQSTAPVEQAAPQSNAFADLIPDAQPVAEQVAPEAIQPEAQPDIGIPASEQNQPLTEATNAPENQPAVLVNDPQPVLPAPDGVGVTAPVAQEVEQQPLAMAAKIEGTQDKIAVPVEMPAPAQINGEQASQVTAASPGMRPGDIVDATGKPFATPQQAKNHAKAAGPGWTVKKGQGGHVVRYQPPSEKQIANGKRQAKNAASIDTSRDSLFAAIAKLGGVSEAALTKEWGFDPSEFKNLRVGIKPLMRKAGGMTLDGMAQRLAELGYISVNEDGQFDQAEMYDLFDGELRGNKHFTPAGFENNAQAQKDAEYDAWVKEQDAADLDSLPDDLQNHIEEYLDDHDAIVPDEEASIEAQSKRGLETTDGEIDRIPGVEEEGDRSAAETDQSAQDGANPEERTTAAAQSAEVDDFNLAGETLDQGKARATRDAAQAKSTEQQNKLADQKAQADSERDSFALTGSNRTADVAASQGQTGMFDDVPFSRSGDDGSDIPATYFQNTQVAHDVWITDEARFDTADVSAQEAIESVREDRDNYKRLLDCMRG